jgi:hypothetical protein
MRTFGGMSAAAIRPRPRARELFAEPRSFTIVRRFAVTVVCIQLVLSVWSGYRAIWQVLRLRVDAPATIHSGSTIAYSVLSSGRSPVHLVVELVQGARAETLAVMRVRANEIAGTDPRVIPASGAVTLADSSLAGFASGAAIVRVTGLGSSQWLRVPPPVIRMRQVTIAR